MQRNIVYIIAAVLVILIAGFLMWQHLSQLSREISGLTGQVTDLSSQLEDATQRAEAAEAKAGEAQREAGVAATRAEAAAVQAEEATAREQESTALAESAEQARQRAEELERLAVEARDEAEFQARQAAAARETEAKKRQEAERRSEEALAEAQEARQQTRLAQQEAEEIKQRLEQELDRLQSALGKIADTRRTALGLVMTLDSSQIEFDFNKAELRPENREVLSRIAGVLLTFDNYGVQVFGHTDDVGTVEYNKKLSEDRAAAVRRYLAETGIDPAVMTTMGLGKTSPLVQGTDAESRQRNRRVELAIVFSEGEFEAVQEATGDAEAGAREE